MNNPDVEAVLDEIRGLGAEVSTPDRVASEEAVGAAEAELGFAIPGELREFWTSYGSLSIVLERTWFFYGLPTALERTREYRNELDGFRGDSDDGPYYPARFLVLYDEGDYSNVAEGTVYDHDLKAMLGTAGGRWVDREDAYEVGYWGFLIDTLDDIRDRLADPDDPLVTGSARDLARRRAEREQAPASEHLVRALARHEEAVAHIYATFAPYPRQQRERYCFMGACDDCKTSDASLNERPLHELTRDDLFHFAYNALNTSIEPGDQMPARRDEYKHFLPRILDLLDDLGAKGNPSVVISEILKTAFETDLSQPERAAVYRFLEARWDVLLHDSTSEPRALRDELHAALKVGAPIDPFMSRLRSLNDQPETLRHLARWVLDEKFSEDPEYYGWYDAAKKHYPAVRAWLLSGELLDALDGAAPEADLLTEAADKIRRVTQA